MNKILSYSAELAAIMKRFDDDLQALGEKVLTEIVAPACRRYNIGFRSGNGTFFFYGKRDYFGVPRWSDREDVASVGGGLSDSAKMSLGQILDLLNKEPSHGQALGYFVGDVDLAAGP